MSGILVIAVVGAWLWFCVWLARKVASWMPNEQPRSKLRGIKHPNQKISRGKPRGIEPGEIESRALKILIGLLAFGVLMPLPLIDEIIGKFQFDKLCREEAGVKIYGKLELGPEFFNADGTPNFINKKTNLIFPDKVMDPYVEFVTMPVERLTSPATLYKMRLQVRRREDGKLIAEKTAFGIYGGWLSYGDNAWLPTGCPKGSERFGEIFSQLVTQEQRK